MNSRQVIALVVVTACISLGVVRVVRHVGGGNDEASTGFRETWRCRADGYETNMTLAELDAQVAARTTREDKTNAVPTIFKCPKCGKVELECVRTWK